MAKKKLRRSPPAAALRRRLYLVHHAMVSRCTNPKAKQYSDYGGRGIKVCDRWLDFDAFFADMADGALPGLTLERRDNELGYSPDNCMWASRAEQARNRRSNYYIEYGGERMVIKDWAQRLGISFQCLHQRLAKWPFDKAMTLPRSDKLTLKLAREKAT